MVLAAMKQASQSFCFANRLRWPKEQTSWLCEFFVALIAPRFDHFNKLHQRRSFKVGSLRRTR